MIFRMVKNLDRFFFRFVTMHAFDRQTDRRTDRQTEISSLDRVCIPCSAVKSTEGESASSGNGDASVANESTLSNLVDVAATTAQQSVLNDNLPP